MLLALVFVLARNVIKLLVERRRGLPFARFRAKLVRAARHDAHPRGARAARRQPRGAHRRRPLVQRRRWTRCCHRPTAWPPTTTRSGSGPWTSRPAGWRSLDHAAIWRHRRPRFAPAITPEVGGEPASTWCRSTATPSRAGSRHRDPSWTSPRRRSRRAGRGRRRPAGLRRRERPRPAPWMLEPMAAGGELLRVATSFRRRGGRSSASWSRASTWPGDLADRSRRMTQAYEHYTSCASCASRWRACTSRSS
jgi:hypothetical protein